ncbi:polyprenol phosphomannose-dependent alpha 1,6 mannosyltransferase MptB [Arenibacter sp. BSSL-BM3]|uniref:Polyprenol phosphomannose-dependent alpha 1,6 mannosyltransferase MptB n=2 Tax=Arenibacter arenosicollis TaxID=2762274 RepID=A0ABR7QHB3_9FLAO|nr:polyprenol phosphomannose-dependent alpha 1,6 mannosyltransferase MptB [Arenibacter arenosicollis]MBC8766581.1 polyprenol phosphomannose-dependent alpha 1,6 mannosyltransferase MptB [Arenibacter arenosicollis]
MIQRTVSYWKLHKIPMLMVLFSILFYMAFGYDLDRADFIKLLSLYSVLFFLCYKLIQFEKWNFKFLAISGTLFRLTLLFAEPNLSQDFYRFIWDGQLINNGINPYLHIPKDMIIGGGQIMNNAGELISGMGGLSASNYSNYPPLNQFIFALSTLLSGKSIVGSVLMMRTIIILSDLGILYFGRKLLQKLNKSTHLIFWYFLNPMVILELTGNLHFEGVMLFFFIWSIYLLFNKKWLLGAIVYALSISIKLVPLLFLPLFLKYFGIKKSILFYGVVGITSVLLVLPFYSPEFADNYIQTVGLWFSNFEFNAGLYNVIKKVAVNFDAKPWELIKDYGKITPIIVIALVALFTFVRDNKKISSLMTSMLWVLTFYYFLSATVHPWYIIFLVVLCLFTEFRFPIIWSFSIILSYWAYSNEGFKENYWLLSIEYIAVYGFMIYEILRLYNKKLLFHKN